MADLREIARKIALLQKYTATTGCRTSRSQAELLRDLNAEQTCEVLELAAQFPSPLTSALAGR